MVYQDIALDIWDKKYRLKDKNGIAVDATMDSTLERVAVALASVESTPREWEDRFLWAMKSGAIPGGRILSNAGAGVHKPSTSTINCLAGNTPVLTTEGVVSIKTLVGKATTVLDGNGMYQTVEFKCHGIQPTYSVWLSREGDERAPYIIRATGDHNWFLKDWEAKTTLALSGGDVIPYIAPIECPRATPDELERGRNHATFYLFHHRFIAIDQLPPGSKQDTLKLKYKSLPTSHSLGAQIGFYNRIVERFENTGIANIPKYAALIKFLWSLESRIGAIINVRNNVCHPRALGTQCDWFVNYVDYESVAEEEVFCCEEPITHSFLLFGGMRTGNCTVSATIPDSIDGILQSVKEAGITLHTGAGIGYDFSTLRPKGSYIAGAGAYTSGPLSFMEIYDRMCATISSAGGRRGAQMATFDISHPDVIDYIQSKRKPGMFRNFNLSLLVSDAFMCALKNDDEWALVFPKHRLDATTDTVWRYWPTKTDYTVNEEGKVLCKVHRRIRARDLWDLVMKSTYNYAEPGVLFIDKINQMNNNWWCEDIRKTNPCFTGNTKVVTLYGARRFDELAKSGEDVQVLTLTRDYRFVYRKMTNPRKTQEGAKTIKLHFNRGGSIQCTLNHIFYLSDGSEIEAQDVQVGSKVISTEQFAIVRSIEYPSERHDVYCGTVQDTERFFVSVQNQGILVHNCGEVPLPDYGSCLLGSINLTRFVDKPFTDNALFDIPRYTEVVRVFTRLLDNVVDINGLPLVEQRDEIARTRRHGMGYFGLGSTLHMLKIPYGSPRALAFTREVTQCLALTGIQAGIDLAKEKGMAPILADTVTVTPEFLAKHERKRSHLPYAVGAQVSAKDLYAESEYIRRMDDPTIQFRKQIRDHGIRFTHHSAIAPTGTIALSFGNNASGGIEPSFSHSYYKNVVREGRKTKEKIEIKSLESFLWAKVPLPSYFISANDISPTAHIDIQAEAQKWVDASISKTINVPTDYSYEQFKELYTYAFNKGVKGCTTFRYNPEAFQGVLVTQKDLAMTTYQFTYEDGSKVTKRGDEDIEYDGVTHNAANLYESIKEGTYANH